MNREKVANRISDLCNPYYASSPFFLLVALGAVRPAALALAYWAALSLFFSVIPMWDITRRIRLGLVADAHISRREDRIQPFLVSLGSAVAGLGTVYLVGAPEALKAVAWSVVITGAAITTITIAWKVSLHAAGVTTIAVVAYMLYGPIAIPLALLVPIVAWARLTLHKHTPAQLAAGIFIAAGVSVAVFTWFGLA